MKKVTVTLPDANGGTWGSIKTKYPKDSTKVKYVDFTGTSKNFDTDSTGVITKSLGGINFNSSTFTGAPKDIYEAVFANGTRYLLVMANGVLKYSTGGGTFSDITSGYSTSGNMEFAAYQDRIYFGNGIDASQSLDKTTTYGGVVYTAPKTKAMGAIIPSSAPTAPGAGAAGGSVPLGAHTYKITYLYYDSEESNGSAASGVCTVAGVNQTVGLTAIPVGGYGVTARKVYRDNNDGNWLYIATIANNTATTYSDTSATGTTAIPTDNGIPPVGAYFLQYLDRIWITGVSASGSYVYFSDPALPDIFPASNYVLCNPKDPVIGFIEYSQKILVFNRNSMGWITGNTKDTFRYTQIPSSVGCVDNRSIQIRTTEGVPNVIWLSSKGLYQFNGGSIDYISEDIENQLNVNVQQASQVKGKNTQDTTSDFSAGTATPGIVISGGTVSQPNPKRVWDDQTDWEGGSSLSNVDTKNSVNSIQAPTKFVSTIAAGTHSNTVASGLNVVLSTATDFTGESHLDESSVGGIFQMRANHQRAQSITVSRAGTITALSLRVYDQSPVAGDSAVLRVWSDSGNNPGTVLYTSAAMLSTGTNGYRTLTTTCSVALSPGRYWIGGSFSLSGAPNSSGFFSLAPLSVLFSGESARENVGSGWSNITISGSSNTWRSLLTGYTFSQSPIASSGQWTSATKDTGSSAITTSLDVTNTGTYPSGTSAVTYLEGSADGATWDVSYPSVSLNGTATISVSARRYWRVRLTLAATDDRVSPTLGAPTIKFGTTATWISEAIDHTTDITALNSLVVVSTVPASTTVTTTIATSSDNVSYSSFVAVGSATPARYSKVKVVMTTTADNITTPSVSSVTLKWTLVSSLVSSAINTGATPVGWELFTVVAGTAGTLSYETKTASAALGLAGASYTAITSGTYIASAVHPFIQWKATFTATADNVPTLDSVVVNWFISQTQSIRVASIFDGLAYYLTAAEFGNTTNNIVFKYDADKNFRIYRGVTINCLTYFFNDIYYGSAAEGRVVKWLTGLTNSGVNIEFDVQSAGINYGDPEHDKILRKAYVVGKNTGATYTPQYSTDNGMTWKGMINPRTGLATIVTTSDLSPFKVRFSPVFATDNATGTSHIFRLLNNDAYECSIQSIKLEAWIRQGEPR